ncbi:hypothetical protein P4H61_03985 [Paenibacillus peoriae]|uniref:hypothetical protein n=1 Tax=Paenibacillus peoriae TaxID=59893 RepID=UPI00026C5F3A|nr:hypothetical protein [Paenibacillus peoriae]MEC0180656.1 hypothetical protein [Paenibacillus peoriae]
MRKSSILFLTIVLLLITTYSSNAEKEAFAQSAKEHDTLIVYKLQKGTPLQQLTKKDILATFKDKTDTKIFINALNTSEKISGIVNTASPNYELTFQKDETEESYCLWINPNDSTSNAMYINKKDPYTAYKLSVNSTNSIKKLLVKTKN